MKALAEALVESAAFVSGGAKAEENWRFEIPAAAF